MKLLFVCNNMHIGGIQRALVNLLNEISAEYDVTLMLMSKQGAYLELLNKEIKIITGNKFTKILGMTQREAREDGMFSYLWRSLWVILTRLFSSKFTYNALVRFQRLKEPYDVAISYMQNSAYRYFYGGVNEFVAHSVKANKKISFVHCDFKNYLGNNQHNKNFYKYFDKIACVSRSCANVFIEECPEHKDKVVAVSNCYNYDDMERLSGSYNAEKTAGVLNILTCARISEEKGIFRMFPILADLKQEGYDFIWRIAGEGALYEDAKKVVCEAGLSDNIIFLGNLENPYPYYKSADLLLVPSYNEAAPMVFGEAEYFKLPILSTNTTSAKEMVYEKNIGFVCDNNDAAIKAALEEIFKSPDMLLSKKNTGETNNERAIAEFRGMVK